MSALAWWFIPILATIGAVVWYTWRGQDRPGDPRHTVAQQKKFNDAMRKDNPRGRRRSRVPNKPTDGGSPS
ncbi:MAG: hypothetical protein NTU50_05490 [Actinobacteria bacterium]|nr:hypothetical protein [Actinomycetota bacterium]